MYTECYFRCCCTWCHVSLMLLYVLLYLMSCIPNVTLCVTILMSCIPNVTLCYCTWCHVSRMLLYVLLYLCHVYRMLLCVTALDVMYTECYFVLLHLMSCIPNVTVCVTALDVMYTECYFVLLHLMSRIPNVTVCPVPLTSRPSMSVYRCSRTVNSLRHVA
jgi:hypothetical protein